MFTPAQLKQAVWDALGASSVERLLEVRARLEAEMDTAARTGVSIIELMELDRTVLVEYVNPLTTEERTAAFIERCQEVIEHIDLELLWRES